MDFLNPIQEFKNCNELNMMDKDKDPDGTK
jgi:hypothetical protein